MRSYVHQAIPRNVGTEDLSKAICAKENLHAPLQK